MEESLTGFPLTNTDRKKSAHFKCGSDNFPDSGAEHGLRGQKDENLTRGACFDGEARACWLDAK